MSVIISHAKDLLRLLKSRENYVQNFQSQLVTVTTVMRLAAVIESTTFAPSMKVALQLPANLCGLSSPVKKNHNS